MKKRRRSVYEIIHDGALFCFDWSVKSYEDQSDDLERYCQRFWYIESRIEDFKKIQKYHEEAKSYIEKFKIESKMFNVGFKEQFLNNKDYLYLSTLGNKVIQIEISNVPPREIMNEFIDCDFYYTHSDINEALEILHERLIYSTHSNI